MQLSGGRSPPGAGDLRGSNDNAAVLSMEFHFAAQAGLLEEWLRDANSVRITDGNDAGFDGNGAGHSNYNVITVNSPGKKRVGFPILATEISNI
ncbi:MAG: hypothetical protein ABI035_13905 [Gemmatimonadaceae bacterium]